MLSQERYAELAALIQGASNLKESHVFFEEIVEYGAVNDWQPIPPITHESVPPVAMAIVNHYPEMVLYLIINGANVVRKWYMCAHHVKNVFEYAISENSPEILEAALQQSLEDPTTKSILSNLYPGRASQFLLLYFFKRQRYYSAVQNSTSANEFQCQPMTNSAKMIGLLFQYHLPFGPTTPHDNDFLHEIIGYISSKNDRPDHQKILKEIACALLYHALQAGLEYDFSGTNWDFFPEIGTILYAHKAWKNSSEDSSYKKTLEAIWKNGQHGIDQPLVASLNLKELYEAKDILSSQFQEFEACFVDQLKKMKRMQLYGEKVTNVLSNPPFNSDIGREIFSYNSLTSADIPPYKEGTFCQKIQEERSTSRSLPLPPL